MENPKIFLSHSSKDRILAKELAKQIRGFLGFEDKAVFVSSEPEAIDIGADWFPSVENELKQAEVLIILITPNSMASNWVWFEIGHFWNKNKNAILPLCSPNTSILHPLNTRQAKNLCNLREFNVFLEALKQFFNVNGNYEIISHSEIIMLANESVQENIELSYDGIKAKLLDYLKNEYKLGKAIFYSELDELLKLSVGSTQKYLKQIAKEEKYIVKEERDTHIRLSEIQVRMFTSKGLYSSQNQGGKSKPRS